MNPNASVKSLNSKMRWRFPFTTLQPSILRNPAAILRFLDQLELRLEELQARQMENPAIAPASPVVRPVARPVRRPWPDHLPRETRKYMPKQESCPDCGGKLKPLGEDVSEMLEYVPGHFKVIRQVRPKLACANRLQPKRISPLRCAYRRNDNCTERTRLCLPLRMLSSNVSSQARPQL
jgi:hypothetical protein